MKKLTVLSVAALMAITTFANAADRTVTREGYFEKSGQRVDRLEDTEPATLVFFGWTEGNAEFEDDGMQPGTGKFVTERQTNMYMCKYMKSYYGSTMTRKAHHMDCFYGTDLDGWASEYGDTTPQKTKLKFQAEYLKDIQTGLRGNVYYETTYDNPALCEAAKERLTYVYEVTSFRVKHTFSVNATCVAE